MRLKQTAKGTILPYLANGEVLPLGLELKRLLNYFLRLKHSLSSSLRRYDLDETPKC